MNCLLAYILETLCSLPMGLNKMFAVVMFYSKKIKVDPLKGYTVFITPNVGFAT